MYCNYHMEKTRERDSEREICATLPLGDKWVADVELAIVGSLCETCVRVGVKDVSAYVMLFFPQQ